MNIKIDRNRLIRNCIIVFFMTIVVGFIFITIDLTINNEDRGSGIRLFLQWAIIILPIFSIFNLIFLLLIYYLKISRNILSNWKLILLEIIVYFGLYIGITKLITKIPYEYKFTVTSKMTTIKFYFDFPFDHFYTFILLTLIILIFRKMIEK